MSPEESFLEEVLGALEEAGLEAVVVGTAACALQGAPVMTQDIDLLLRDTPKNREKIGRLCDALGGAKPVQPSPLSSTITLLGPALPLDLLFDRIPPGLSFERVRSRSVRVRVGGREAVVAALADVIASKEACARPKDLAQLPILRDALRVKRSIEETGA
jgi:hypothetical protein